MIADQKPVSLDQPTGFFLAAKNNHYFWGADKIPAPQY